MTGHPTPGDDDRQDDADQLSLLVAEVERLRADAWDEGHREGMDYIRRGTQRDDRDKRPNPYRRVRRAGGAA